MGVIAMQSSFLTQAAEGEPPAAATINVPTNTDPVHLIVNIYQFALLASGALAFLMVVYAGIMYSLSAGDPSKASEATGKLTDTALGILLLFCAFILLRTISPGLTTLTLPALAPANTAPVSAGEGDPIVGDNGIGSGGDNSGHVGVGGSCDQAESGNPCSVENMRAACAKWDPVRASRVCNYESAGGQVGIPSGVDLCQPGGEKISWGLMQINLTANKVGGLDCPKAFDRAYTGSNRQCHVVDNALYQQCIAAAKNPSLNLQAACGLYEHGGFAPWQNTVNKCGI